MDEYSVEEFYSVVMFVCGKETADKWLANKASHAKLNANWINNSFTWAYTAEGDGFWAPANRKVKEFANTKPDIEMIVQMYSRMGLLDKIVDGSKAPWTTPPSPPKKPKYDWISVGIESYEARRLRKKEEEKILRKNEESRALRKAVKEMGELAKARILTTLKAMDEDFSGISEKISDATHAENPEF